MATSLSMENVSPTTEMEATGQLEVRSWFGFRGSWWFGGSPDLLVYCDWPKIGSVKTSSNLNVFPKSTYQEARPHREEGE